MVEFSVNNEIFLAIMMGIVIPFALWINRSNNKIINKLTTLITCFELSRETMKEHIKESDTETDKLNQLSEKSSMHTIIIERLQEDIRELKGSKSAV